MNDFEATPMKDVAPLWIDRLMFVYLPAIDNLIIDTCRYRPANFDEMDIHKSEADMLLKLADAGDFPHLLFNGPNGAGKRTLIRCFLKTIYGNGVDSLRIENHEFQTAGGKKFDLQSLGSNFHIEINPSTAGLRDRIVVQNLIKSAAQVFQLIFSLCFIIDSFFSLSGESTGHRPTALLQDNRHLRRRQAVT